MRIAVLITAVLITGEGNCRFDSSSRMIRGRRSTGLGSARPLLFFGWIHSLSVMFSRGSRRGVPVRGGGRWFMPARFVHGGRLGTVGGSALRHNGC